MRTGASGGGSSGRDVTTDLAKGLGVFSLALGSAELADPGAVARLAGIRGDGPAVHTEAHHSVRAIHAYDRTKQAVGLETERLHVLREVHRYMPRLLEHIRNGDVDPSFVITHRTSLDDAPTGYRTFVEKADGCEKVVLTP